MSSKKLRSLFVLSLSMSLSLVACSKQSQTASPSSSSYERKLPATAFASKETTDTVAAVKAAIEGTAPAPDNLKITGKARIGVLYYTDRPAHREAVLNWFKSNQGDVTFESQKFGYLEASLDWDHLGQLIATSGQMGLADPSMYKLELDSVSVNGKNNNTPPQPDAIPGAEAQDLNAENSSYFGPVHSSGYGAHVDEFRTNAARDLGMNASDLNGKGSLIAVFDGGIDLSRTDVYGNRIRDFFVGEDESYITAEQGLADFMKAEGATATPKGLEDVATEASLRFVTLKEAPIPFDLNGAGTMNPSISVAVYNKNGHSEARFRPAKGLNFGDAVLDFGDAHKAGVPSTINLYTGRYYTRTAPASPSAVAVKFKTDAASHILIAFVGVAPGADHGMSNLHMAGGDFTDGAGKVKYQGVATGAEFIGAQPWKIAEEDYGATWLSLARTITQSAEAGADILDLDIYTPGTRGGMDFLSRLLCRVTDKTSTVPVVAAHNYGPLPDTIQSLAQSPCVLGIGASHSMASLKYGRNDGAIDPALTTDDAVQTASYSGRGFGMNGMFKPDVISPAYGYTAYGQHFIRFGGTSGATPTTAGMIALLKQAARAKGVELNFEQVKFLLQGSSHAVDPAHVRDGYGFSDLAAAWELFKKYNDGKSFNLNPFRLEGQVRIAFDGRPTQQNFALNLTRASIPASANTLGSEDSAQAMRFSVDYAGASVNAPHWLKFFDPAQGKQQEVLDWDAPMNGESQPLNFVISLSDADWAALPIGDHVAVIKGVRKSIANGRNIDFIQPVTFTKAAVVDETNLTINPLYSDEFQIFDIATRPGEHLIIQGTPQCSGSPAASSIAGQNASAPFFLIDNEASYEHSSEVMSTYSAMSLDPGAISVVAKKNVVHLAVVRYRLFNCDGPMTGSIMVRRLGFDFNLASNGFTQSTTALKASASATFKLSAEALSSAELSRGVTWSIKKDTETLVLRNVTQGPVQFTLPKGIQSVRVIAKDPTKFAGILVEEKASAPTPSASSAPSPSPSSSPSSTPSPAPIPSQEVTQAAISSGQYTGGFEAAPTLALASPTAGDTVRYVPDAGEGKAATTVTIELVVSRPDSISVEMAASAPLTTWIQGTSNTVALQVTSSLSRPETLKDFAPSSWTYGLRIPFSIHETQPNSTDTDVYVDQTLWSTTGELSLPLE